MTKTEQILHDALDLLPVERAELAEKILASFLLPLDKSIDNLWSQEAEDRIAAYENGQVKSIPAQRVFDKIDNENQ